MADATNDNKPIAELKARLEEAEDTLRAIRAGEIDALVVQGPAGEQVYTLRSAEQPYRNLVEEMGEGASILTTAGDILYCNRSFARLVGVPLERVVGGHVLRFFTGEDRAAVEALLKAGSGKRRAQLLGAGGRTFDVYLSLTTTTLDDAERRSLIVTDLSELIDAQSGRDRAERASHAKDEFMAMLAHELRNPLSAITAAVEVLKVAGGHEAALGRARGIIVRQVQHLSRLVDDLLEVGRVITGKVTLTREKLDIAEVVRRSVSTFTQRPIGRNIEVDVEPAWVEGDFVRIEQIVTNIVANAVKYTPSGGYVRITLRAEGNQAVLRVTDNGFGITPELLPRIFDAFVQGERTLDRSEGGLGIGLTLVQRLVELHGGTVSAASDGVGCGSCFTVCLPCVEPPGEPALQPSALASTPLPRRVLVIEDNRDARETFRMMLELAGHEVLEAEEGQQGLELLRAVRPDIAVIDVGLPGLDGYEVARRFRAEPASDSVVLVALTGYGTPEARERSQQAGFDHHLIKPVNPELLRELMNRSGPPAHEAMPVRNGAAPAPAAGAPDR
jgi:PAS domain S-box-containing protein